MLISFPLKPAWKSDWLIYMYRWRLIQKDLFLDCKKLFSNCPFMIGGAGKSTANAAAGSNISPKQQLMLVVLLSFHSADIL